MVMPTGSPGGHCPSCLLRIGLALAGGGLKLERTDPLAPGPAPLPPLSSRIHYIGDYELLEEIGRGGMGVVYQARQLSLNRLIALKLLRTGEFADEKEIARFHAEAEAAADLDHPNIVPIYEVGEHEGRHYFSMKLMEGGSLAGATAASPKAAGSRESPAGNREIAARMALIARAIHYAHQRGLLHRDLKPGNILLDAQGQPHVTDFGLAKRLEGDRSLTLSGAIVGTPCYIAPEQAAGVKQLTTAADIYSLGAILYELLVGHPPFVGATVLETLQKVIHDPPVPPWIARRERANRGETKVACPNPQETRGANSGTSPAIPTPPAKSGFPLPRGMRPSDLDFICLKCLEKDPACRYPSAEAFADDLDRWLRQEPTLARPATAAERLGKWTRRNPVFAGLLAAVLIVALLGFTGIVWQWREAVAARRSAEQATRAREDQLWQTLGQQAHFSRLSGQLGQRTNALAALATAAAIRPSLPLRQDALAALMLPDLGARLWWKEEPSFEHPWCFDSALEHYLPHTDFPLGQMGRLLVRHSGDHRVVADLGEIPRQPSAALFSPDDRWIAVRLADGDLRVWDWRTSRLRARSHCGDTSWARRSFDFSPDSRTLYFGDTNGGVSRLELDTGALSIAVKSGPASLVRLSPSGRRLLTISVNEVQGEVDPPVTVHRGSSQPSRVNEVQVWEVDPPRRLVLTNFASFPPSGLLGAAWHPNEELLVLAVKSGLFLWHWPSGEQRPFERVPPSYPYDPCFNRVGDLVFVGGQVWDVATQRRLLTVSAQLGSFLALSADETRMALQVVKTGFGVWEFLPPLGTRVFLENPFVASLSLPDLAPNGRWLASAQADGWRVWDLSSGRVLARGPETVVKEARFTADSRALVTVGHDGLKRWPLSIANVSEQSSLTVGPAELLLAGLSSEPTLNTRQRSDPRVSQQVRHVPVPAEYGTITRGGHFAVLSGNGDTVVVEVARTNLFPLIHLLNADVEFRLSPDGRWLATGRHNKSWFDLWEVGTGRHALPITNPPFLSCQFHPATGELIAWNQSEVIVRAPDLGSEIRRFSWPEGSLIGGLLPGGVASEGRVLWCYSPDGQLALVDGASGQLLARLERPGGFGANSIGLDARGDHAGIGTAYNAIRHLDLAALRRELARLGLDWPDEHPGEGFAPAKK